MFKEWLTIRKSIDQIEAEHLVTDERLGPDPVPFGFQNAKWVEFRQAIQDGDELWEFSSPPGTWRNLCGRAGIALVRQGEIMDSILPMFS